MLIRRIFCLLPAFALLCTPARLAAQFYERETRDLRLIYYTKQHEYVVPHLAACFENAMQFHRSIFHYTPSERVTLILQDFGDYAGGGANSVPFNLIGIGIAPFSYTYETMPAVERMTLMMNHEITHVVTTDKPSPSNKFFRSLFLGKVHPIAESPPSMLYGFLTNPRWNAPRWYIESIAVFMETWMAGGLGRALGAYDEMVFRTMVRDSSEFYDIVGLESEGTKVDFQVGANSYLYGTRFVSHLAYQYGPEKLLNWFSPDDKSKSYFASQFENVYGVSLDTEWSRWIEWEHQWQKANLDSIRQFPVTPYRSLSSRGLGSVSRAFFDPSTRKIYAGINYPGQSAHLAAIDLQTGTIDRIKDIRGAALFYVCSLAYDLSTSASFYTTDNNHWRDLNSVNLNTGESKMLLKDVRTGDFAFNRADRSLWGIRHFNGISTIVRIPFPYDDWNQIYSWDYGKDMFDIDISPDGNHLTGALADVSGRQVLIEMDIDKLMKGDTSYKVLFDFENSTPANFVFSPDGRYLFGNSYYSGVSNIVRYDFDHKKMEWISNCESGFFRPIPISDDSLIVFHFTGKGFVPVMIANRSVEDVSAVQYLGQAVVEKYPTLKTWSLPPPSSIKIDSLTTFSGEYKPLQHVRIASAYPIVEGYRDFVTVGLRLNANDPVMLHAIDVTGSYSPNVKLPESERFHFAFNYRFLNWRVSGTYNGSDFYDLFGPTKKSRKGYSLAMQYKGFLVYDEPETMDYSIRLAGYGNLLRLPDFQNVSTTFDRFATLTGMINYKNFSKSLGAVEDERGVQWELTSHTTIVRSQVLPRINADFSAGLLLPFNHSSLWFRGSLGQGFGNASERFANFYVGGFGNNWIDFQDVHRYRENYSFPGIELNAVGGKNYLKAMVEWTLPPLRFRRLGFPTLYGNWMRLALFGSGVVTNLDSKNTFGDGSGLDKDLVRRALVNVGAQLDFRIVMFWSLESTFSLGYASAFERSGTRSDEFMVSLKIL